MQHVISRNNDAAAHANARNHPEDDIKRDRRRPPEAIRVEGALLRSLVIPGTTREKKAEGEREENGPFIFPHETAMGGKKSGKRSRFRAAGSIDRLTENNKRLSLTRRRLSKCENRHRNWTRYYR